MKLALKPLAAAILIAATQLSAVAFAQTATATAPIAIQSPSDWIIYDKTTCTPVADSISLHLDAARKAFDAKDTKKAAAEMRTVADKLREQAVRAAKADKTRVESEMKLAQDTSMHMNAVAGKVSATAAGIENGKIKTRADLDKAIDKAARADMDRRWLMADVTTWYPVSEEPQRHFGSAATAFARKDYKTAATEIRKATGYMRLESGRVTGDARQTLDSSVAELDKLATAVEKGSVKDEKIMDKTFANADHALALAHRTNAAESWARKEYDETGYELKAAAHDLESAAGWAGTEARAGASGVVADTRALGDKLATGATWTRDEVVRDFAALGHALNELGHKIGAKQHDAPAISRS